MAKRVRADIEIDKDPENQNWLHGNRVCGRKSLEEKLEAAGLGVCVGHPGADPIELDQGGEVKLLSRKAARELLKGKGE